MIAQAPLRRCGDHLSPDHLSEKFKRIAGLTHHTATLVKGVDGGSKVIFFGGKIYRAYRGGEPVASARQFELDCASLQWTDTRGPEYRGPGSGLEGSHRNEQLGEGRGARYGHGAFAAQRGVVVVGGIFTVRNYQGHDRAVLRRAGNPRGP